MTRLADMHGKRMMMTVCLAVMVSGSVVGAFSDTAGPAIGARALQGVGVALIPVGIAAMRDELPPERVPLGVALMSATLAVGAGAGLPLSGFVVAHLDWHAVFWVTGAGGLVMLIAVPLVLNRSPAGPRGSFDVAGAVVLSLGLTAVLLALTPGGQWGWSTPATLGCAVGGLAVLAVLVPLELRSRNPLVNIRLADRQPRVERRCPREPAGSPLRRRQGRGPRLDTVGGRRVGTPRDHRQRRRTRGRHPRLGPALGASRRRGGRGVPQSAARDHATAGCARRPAGGPGTRERRVADARRLSRSTDPQFVIL